MTVLLCIPLRRMITVEMAVTIAAVAAPDLQPRVVRYIVITTTHTGTSDGMTAVVTMATEGAAPFHLKNVAAMGTIVALEETGTGPPGVVALVMTMRKPFRSRPVSWA